MFVRIPCVPVWSRIGGIGHTRFWGDRGGFAAKMRRLRPLARSLRLGAYASEPTPRSLRLGERAIPTLGFVGRWRASIIRISATAATEKTASCLRAGAGGRGLRA
jgi:hypothetical protein